MSEKYFKIPPQWDSVNLGEVITLINGRAYKKPELLDSGTPIIRIQNLNGGKNWYYSDLELPEDKYCEEGDLLFAWSATFGPYIWSGPKAIYHYHIWKLQLSEKIDFSFAYRLIEFTTQRIKDAAHGITMVHITKSKMEDWLIPLPPLAEQRRIAAILDKADAIRLKQQQAIDLCDQFLKALFIDMFGDPVTNPKGWEVKKLENVCDKITDGTHHSPPLTDSGVPYVTAKHVKLYGLDFKAKPSYVSEESHRAIYSRCSPVFNDVLYIKDGATTGIATLNTFKREISLLSSLALIKPDKQIITSEFIVAWLNNPIVKENLLSNMSGAAIKRFTLKKIKDFKIFSPSLDLQNKFAEIVKKTEAKKAKMQKSLERLNDNFNSLSQRAFAGKLS